MTDDEMRNCMKHGFTLFKCLKNRKGFWYACQKCRRIQARIAQAKRRKIPAVREYQKNFNKELNKIRKSLSVYLVMILLAAKIKPE